jgi:hypothetical protein
MDLKYSDANNTVGLVSYRVPFIRDGLLSAGQIDSTQWQSPRPLHGLKILDVGCGGGILAEVRDYCVQAPEAAITYLVWRIFIADFKV